MTESELQNTLHGFGITVTLPDGKKVMRGWVGINCPRCGGGNTLGINTSSLRVSCWKCGLRGALVWVLVEYMRLPYHDLISALKGKGAEKYVPMTSSVMSEIDQILKTKPKLDVAPQPIEVPQPLGLMPVDFFSGNEHLMSFLDRRGYTIEDCISAGALFGVMGHMAYRLCIPVTRAGVVVAWQGRTVIPNTLPKYLTVGPVNVGLYGQDKVKPGQTCVLCEGFLDAWRLGVGALCSFGKHLTKRQLLELIALRPRPLVLAWDADAFWEIAEVEKFIAPHGITCVRVEFPEAEDPDSYGREASWKLINESIARALPDFV